MRELRMSDLELFYTGERGHPFLGIGVMEGLQELQKTRAPILSSTSGFLNAIYGPQAWAQINGEAVPFGIVPKTNWDRSGFRVITDEEGTYTDMGLGEDDTLPDSIKPTVELVKPVPKTMAKTFELSDIQEAMAELGADDAFGTLAHLRQYRAVTFARKISQALMHDVEADASGAGANFDQSAYKLLMPFDRAISNDAEEDMYGGTYTSFYDYYDCDRDTGTTYDCIVKMGPSANTPQDLDDELLRDTIADAHKAGGRTTVMLTGWDTYAKLQGIYLSLMRYNDPLLKDAMAQFGINGIKTAEGKDVGIPIASVHGIPLVCTQDAVIDGTGISRILGLDLTDEEGFGYPRFGISMLRPVEYYESRDFINLNRFVLKGAYRIVAEVYCRWFPGQWKMKDLQ